VGENREVGSHPIRATNNNTWRGKEDMRHQSNVIKKNHIKLREGGTVRDKHKKRNYEEENTKNRERAGKFETQPREVGESVN